MVTPPFSHLLSPGLVDALVDRALAEDLEAGDVTTDTTVGPDVTAKARALAKSDLVVCGGALFLRVFERIDPNVKGTLHAADGTSASKGTVLFSVEGSARSLLYAERTALNFVQRMSGTATLARTYVNALPPGCSARITDTRKTTPGLRALERYAVRTGGAHNHRNDLSSAVLIKDNHIVAAGGIGAAIERARQGAPHTSRIEVEVANLDQLGEALAARADVIMLDNFGLEAMKEAVRRARGQALLEASGGVNLSSVAEIAKTGVDIISVGALTHSAPAADISLDLQVVT